MQKFGKHCVNEWMIRRLGHRLCLKFVSGDGGKIKRCAQRVNRVFDTCFNPHVDAPVF
jgi:hypothetical protein